MLGPAGEPAHELRDGRAGPRPAGDGRTAGGPDMSVCAPMSDPSPVLYEARERVARITLNRPERGNGITPALLRELVACVERADLDPSVHVVLLSGNGAGFCGGYDLVDSAEQMGAAAGSGAERRAAARRSTRR